MFYGGFMVVLWCLFGDLMGLTAGFMVFLGFNGIERWFDGALMVISWVNSD